MYEALVALANERVITAADFEQFVSQSTWGVFDDGATEVVAKVEIIAVVAPWHRMPLGMVIVRIDGRKENDAFEPDELAIRIEES